MNEKKNYNEKQAEYMRKETRLIVQVVTRERDTKFNLVCPMHRIIKKAMEKYYQ